MLRTNIKRALCLLFCLLFVLACVGCQSEEPDLTLTVVDVGQSDCIFLEIGGESLLIDTGSAISRSAVSAFLSANGIRSIDYLLLTHPHEDHIGNARMVIEQYGVKRLLVPALESEDFGYELILSAAERCETAVERVANDRELSLGNATCEILVPEGEADGNNASLVLRIELDGVVLLLMGDAEKEAEQALLARCGAEFLDCDFLKLGHHGSKTSSSEAFLQAVSPSVAAISCGRDNEFGFPHSEVLERLAALDVAVYRTDLSGELVFEVKNGILQRREA